VQLLLLLLQWSLSTWLIDVTVLTHYNRFTLFCETGDSKAQTE